MKHCISEESSGQTAHLKKVPMENICVAVVYISDTVKPVLNGISRDQNIFPLKPGSV